VIDPKVWYGGLLGLELGLGSGLGREDNVGVVVGRDVMTTDFIFSTTVSVGVGVGIRFSVSVSVGVGVCVSIIDRI